MPSYHSSSSRCGFMFPKHTFSFTPLIRSLPLSMLSTTIAILLHTYDTDRWTKDAYEHPYPFQIFAFIVGFALVFRNNLAMGRFWEGRGALQAMGAKWADVAIQNRVFNSLGDKKTIDNDFADRICHLLSLMHALALQNLRGDMYTYTTTEPNQSLNEHHNLIPHDDERSPMSSAPYVLPVSKRLNNLFLFESSEEDRQLLFQHNKLSVLGGISPTEAKMLFQYQEIAHERVAVVMEMIISEITIKHTENPQVASPIMSRTFQVLSDGHYLGFMTARKVADTRVPLPYDRSHSLFVFCFCMIVPFVVVAFLDSGTLIGILTFLSSWSYLLMLQVAQELENPFDGDSNDLPLSSLQFQFNQRIRGLRKKDDFID